MQRIENRALASRQSPVFCVRALGQRRPRFPSWRARQAIVLASANDRGSTYKFPLIEFGRSAALVPLFAAVHESPVGTFQT
jgi:hypothetical protein